MTPQGFVKAFSAMESLIQKLEQAGMIQRKGAPAPHKEESAASPNFQ